MDNYELKRNYKHYIYEDNTNLTDDDKKTIIREFHYRHQTCTYKPLGKDKSSVSVYIPSTPRESLLELINLYRRTLESLREKANLLLAQYKQSKTNLANAQHTTIFQECLADLYCKKASWVEVSNDIRFYKCKLKSTFLLYNRWYDNVKE